MTFDLRDYRNARIAACRPSLGWEEDALPLAEWQTDPQGFCPPGGETHFELHRRSAAVLAEVAASHARTVIVGHGVSGAVLRGINLGLDAKAMFVLEKPQDAFFRLTAGREERIDCKACS